MSENNERVTQRQLFEQAISLQKDLYLQAQVLSTKIDVLTSELRVQNQMQGETIARLCVAGEAREKRLDKIDSRDKWGSIISGIGIAIGTALGIIVKPRP